MAFDIDALVRLIHIVAAVLWFGGGLFQLTMIAPAVRAAGPAGGAVMQAALRRGGFGSRWFGPASLTTVLSGAWLYVRYSYHEAPFAGVPNTVLTIGVAVAILAFVHSIIALVPTENRMKAMVRDMREGAPPTPEQAGTMQRLAAKQAKAATYGMAMVGLALVLMAGRNIFT